jgi:hypothetical protein
MMVRSFMICILHRILLKSRRMRFAGHVTRMGERRCACRVLVGKGEGKRPIGRRRRRWEDNIKVDLKGIVRAAWNGSVWPRARPTILSGLSK